MKKKIISFIQKSVLLLFLLFSFGSMYGQVDVNPGAGNYADLASAFAAINAGAHTGAVTVDIVVTPPKPQEVLY
ncbi:MAG: hypothetical protein IPL27_19355 [Lewinellaceae bacterium]|nr:hypothetical protein [Lewinellaceae bacterium]